MADKILNTRIKLKYDLYSNWSTNNPVLLAGEVALAYIPTDSSLNVGNGTVGGTTPPQVLVKVGDGTNHYNDLKYVSALAADVLSACKSEDALKTFINGVIADAGIATSEAMEALAGRVSTVESDIATLNGDSTKEGSVAKQIADAIVALNLGETYAAKVHTHTKADITDFAHTHETTEVNGLSDAIKDAKKAGTDANTALEAYKVTNDARVKAVEDDIAEINDGTNGILAQAKAYADGKDTAMDTRVAALETAAPTHALKTEVEAVDAKFADYNTTAAQKAIDDAQDAEIAKKVDKVEGKDLIATSEITRLASVTNYDDTAIKADIAKKADATETTNALEGKVDKVEGYSLISDDEIVRLADVDNYDDTEVRGLIGGNADAIDALEEYVGTIPEGATATDIVGYIQEKTSGIASEGAMTELGNRVTKIEEDYLVEADIANFETKENVQKVADDLAAYVESNDEALAGVKATAEAARTEEEVNSQIEAKITALDLANTYEPKGAEQNAKDYVDQKFTDANLDQYTTEQEVKDIVDGVIAGAADSETYNSLTKLVDYIDAHGGEATQMAQAIDTLEGKVETIEGKPAYDITETQISNWDNEVGAKALAETKTTTAEVKTQIEAYGYATEADLTLAENRVEALEDKPAAGITADQITSWDGEVGAKTAAETAQKTIDDYATAHAGDYTNEQIDAAIDADVKALADGVVADNTEAIEEINTKLSGYGDIVSHNVDEFATSAQGTKADEALQSVEAGTGLKVSAKADNKQTIEIDESVTFVFDCGDSNI